MVTLKNIKRLYYLNESVKYGVTKVKKETKEVEEKPKKTEKPSTEFRALVRVANTDLDGEKQLVHALRGVKGVSYTMAKAICTAAGFDPRVKLSSLSESNIELLEKVIYNPKQYGIPSYLLNRRRDLKTGEDSHLIGSDLDVGRKFDVERYINLKTYRGWRHMLGQPVRGQSTRSHFREKGRVVGVTKKTIKIAEAEKEKK